MKVSLNKSDLFLRQSSTKLQIFFSRDLEVETQLGVKNCNIKLSIFRAGITIRERLHGIDNLYY